MSMQISVTCCDMDFPAALIEINTKSLVSDVIRTVADEWCVVTEELELSFGGEIVLETTNITSLGVCSDSELIISKKKYQLFELSNLVNESERKKVISKIGKNEILRLDTPTFSNDGRVCFDAELVPLGISTLIFGNCSRDVSTISERFLDYCHTITKIDLSGLSSVTVIEDNFLCSCSSLTKLDVSVFINVTSIGSYFLYDCSLRELNLSGFHNVTDIGTGFLARCSSITQLDFSSFCNVTSVGDAFLKNCSSIKTLDMTGFSSLTSIGIKCLSCCYSVESLDISKLRNVTFVGNGFLGYGDSEIIKSVRLPNENEDLFIKASKLNLKNLSN